MLYLVRHGRTAANARGLLLGRLDPDLDDLGRRQAAALATVIPQGALVVSSPLRRTRSTAAALAGVAADEVSTDERWIELDYGAWDGTPLGEVPADAWAAWRADLAFAPPGGESLQELGQRVRAALTDLVTSAVDRDVVVVSHVSPIKAAVAWALGVDDDVAWRLFLSPASVTAIRTGPGAPSLVCFNDTAHLAELAD